MSSPVLLRRIRRGNAPVAYELMTDVPADERLCGYADKNLPELKGLADDLGLDVGKGRKVEVLAALDAAARAATPRRRD